MRQMSSTHSAICGITCETQVPLCPCCLNLKGVPMRGPGLPKKGSTPGSLWPSLLVSWGLGSKRSNPLGPPSWNNQITALARGVSRGMCWATAFRAVGAANSPWSLNRVARASMPMPEPHRVSMSRRVQRRGFSRCESQMLILVIVQEFVQSEHGLAVIHQGFLPCLIAANLRLLCEEIQRKFQFLWVGGTTERHQE